jgi:hypothetical protein
MERINRLKRHLPGRLTKMEIVSEAIKNFSELKLGHK